MISYIYKCKNFFIKISVYSLCYNSVISCCKKRPTQEQLIQLEIEKHNKLVKNKDNFFENTNRSVKKDNVKKGYTLFDNVNERNRINFKIRRATSSADFDKIIGVINSNKVLNEEIKKNLLEDVNKKKTEAKNREDEFNKAKDVRFKNKKEIYDLYKIATYSDLEKLMKNLKDNKALFTAEELEKLEKSIANKGLQHEYGIINDFYANKNDITLKEIDELKSDVGKFTYIDEQKKNDFINYLDKYKIELQDLEKAKDEEKAKKEQIQKILNEIIDIEDKFKKSKEDCDDNNLENLKTYKNKTIELKKDIDTIDIKDYGYCLGNKKKDLSNYINEEKFKSAEKYIDKCIKVEDLREVEDDLEKYDKKDKEKLKAKIKSKRESLLQKFKEEFDKYLKYCNNHDISNIKNNDIIDSIKNLPELKKMINDTTDTNEYMKKLNNLKYHYILRKIGICKVVDTFTEDKFEFNPDIIDKNSIYKNGKLIRLESEKEIKNLKIATIERLKSIYTTEEITDYFRCVYNDKNNNEYSSDEDYIKNQFNNYKHQIYNCYVIATVKIDEDNKYVIYSRTKLEVKKKQLGKTVNFYKCDGSLNPYDIKDCDLTIAYVRQFENTNS